MTDPVLQATERALQHAYHLAETIGPRPPATASERAAALYVVDALHGLGLEPQVEPCETLRNIYTAHALSFTAATAGSLLAAVGGRRLAMLGAWLNGLALWSVASEFNFDPNPASALAPHATSQNVWAVIPARSERRQRLILVGHLDSHVSPIFFSTPGWIAFFNRFFSLAFASLGAGAALGGLGAGRDGAWRRGLLGLGAGIQTVAAALAWHAAGAPVSPGANDNAAAVGVVLALGERLLSEPLEHTEVWLLATGAEEVGCYGMRAFLDRHVPILDPATTFFLDFELPGIGDVVVTSQEGMLKNYPYDPTLLKLAEVVGAAHPELGLRLRPGPTAYSEMGVLVKRGFRGLVVGAEPRAGSTYWHTPEDTFDKIEGAAVERVHRFAWTFMQLLDRRVAPA
ncbi:MAG: M28 family metallopeptidase [Ardenticatenaceae bacterium]|nr:M28 family metallopeptidase [Ardenticatenaceae bacterium]